MYFQWLIRAEVRCWHAASAFNDGIIWCPTEAADLVCWGLQHLVSLHNDGRRWFQLVIKWSFLISWGRLCILNKHDQKHGYSKPSAIWNYIMMYSITLAHGPAPKMPMTTSHWKKRADGTCFTCFTIVLCTIQNVINVAVIYSNEVSMILYIRMNPILLTYVCK